MIEDSKGRASTSKGLKKKKTALEYKGKGQKGKNKRFKGTYYICNKEEHKANDCRSHPKKNKKDQPQGNMIDHVLPSLSVVVSEVNMATNNKDLWVDTVFENLLFSDYQKLEYDEQLFMGNSAISKVKEKGRSF